MENSNGEDDGYVRALMLMIPAQAWDTLEGYKYSAAGTLHLQLSYTPSQAAMLVELCARLLAEPPVSEDILRKLRPDRDFMPEDQERKQNDRRRQADAIASIDEIGGHSDISIKCSPVEDAKIPDLNLTLILRADQVERLVDLKSRYEYKIANRNVAALKGEENFSPDEVQHIAWLPQKILTDIVRDYPIDEAASARYIMLAQANIASLLMDRGQLEIGKITAADSIPQLSIPCRNRCRSIVNIFLEEMQGVIRELPECPDSKKGMRESVLMMGASEIPCIRQYMEAMLGVITEEISHKIRDNAHSIPPM